MANVNTTPVTYYVHTDHLDRPIRMTNAAKASVWNATWLPFGAPHAITGTASLDARFPGQWFQLESGLAYNWHRHYDPTLGRYTQADPLGFVDGPAIYAYAGNSPQMWTDPTGLMMQPDLDLTGNLPGESRGGGGGGGGGARGGGKYPKSLPPKDPTKGTQCYTQDRKLEDRQFYNFMDRAEAARRREVSPETRTQRIVDAIRTLLKLISNWP